MKNGIAEKLKTIAHFAGAYREIESVKYEIAHKDQILQDWWEALKLFFNKSFYRGRRDEISGRFHRIALESLTSYFGNDAPDAASLMNKAHGKGWNRLSDFLLTNGLNNKGDRKMVISTLEFICDLGPPFSYNIAKFCKKKIEEGRLSEVYTRIIGIDFIGDKLASLFLRDLVVLYDLNVKNEDFDFLQPVDTWVKQVAIMIGLIEEKASFTAVKKAIIDSCLACGISPIEFNMGAWYVGANSFQVLLDKNGVLWRAVDG